MPSLAAEDGAVNDERVAGLAARYGDDADAYRDHWAPVLLPLTTALLDRLPLADARLVVDVGTGVGAAIPEIEARAPKARVIGVDRSIGMLRLARRPPARVVMDAMRLAIASDVADVVVAAFMLFHLPDPVAGLREIRRVTRRGGRVGITVWGTDAETPGWTIWEEELNASGAPEPDPGKRIANQEAMDTPGKLTSLLGKAGFSAVRVEARPLGYQPDLKTFMQLQKSYSSRERLSSLKASARDACVERAEKRLRELTPADIADPSEVLLATASA
jgi:ubiquinone/menaquinone biosynthesis C-methylase UbiE